MSSDNIFDTEWWRCRGAKEAAKKLVAWSRAAIDARMPTACRAYQFASMFEGFSLTNLQGMGRRPDASTDLVLLRSPIIRNKVRRLTLTGMNKLFANDSPLPAFTTKGGDWEQQLKAEHLGDLTVVEFDDEHGAFNDVHELHRHGGTFATSAVGSYGIFAFPGWGKVEAELDDTLTIGLVRESRFGPIQTLCRTKWVDPEALVLKYPKQAMNIRRQVEEVQAPVQSGGGMMLVKPGNLPAIMDRKVRIVQGWRVKIGDTLGRYIYCLADGTVLEHGPWKRTKPPGRFWHFELETDGEWGTPLTQTHYVACEMENRILADVEDAERNTPQLLGVTQRGKHDSRDPNTTTIRSQLSGSKGVTLVEVDGPPAGAIAWQENTKYARKSLELAEYLDDAQHQDTSIAQHQSGGFGQHNSTSGIQEHYNASYFTENFADQERRLVRLRAIETAVIFVWALEDMLASPQGSTYSRWVGPEKLRHELKGIDIQDALDLDKYAISIKAVSEDVDSPQARLEELDKQLKLGLIGPPEWVEQRNKTLDVMRAAKDSTAIKQWVKLQHQRWLKTPKTQMLKPEFYQSPERWMGLDELKSALKSTAVAYLQARQDGAPGDRQKWFEKFENECVAVIDQEEKRLAMNAGTLQAPAQPAAAPAEAAPSPTMPAEGAPMNGAMLQ